MYTPENKTKSCKTCGGEKDDSNGQTGAMLNMLAEVASQTLRQTETATPVVRRKRSKEACGMPLNQAKMLSGNQLVRTFSRFEGDELRRTFSFQCLLIPRKCCVRFESFGSETKARNLIKDHLLSHLDDLPEGEVLQVPKQHEEIPVKKQTYYVKNKKVKAIKPEPRQIIETTEIPIETCPEIVIESEPPIDVHVGQPCNPISMALAKCYEELQTHDINNAADHDYFKAPVQSVDMTTNQEEYTAVETIWVKAEEEYESNGITNYVVAVDDNEDNPMLSVSNEVVVKTEIVDSDFVFEEIQPEQYVDEFITIKTEPPVLQDNRLLEDGNFEENCVERDEHRQHKKPKGKAKFIGQSAAEKEMAVRMIESMKLRQGSSEPLECQICVPSRVFTAPTTLISHYRSHAGIKPYECHLCGGVFTRQHSLNYHLLIHSNKTRFTCSDCGRKFRHPSHFKEHQRRHTGEAPFECSDCVIRFKTRNTYKRHLKTRHGKVLTQSGGIIILSEEEFRRVRTAPRSLQARVSSDKENNRRPRTKVVNLIRRNKQKRPEEDEEIGDLSQKLNLSDTWNTNLLESEVNLENEPQLAFLQTVGSGPTTVMVLSTDNILYNSA
ncbi:zinc finger and BTB domain-containing protein 49-like [Macrosteles quadrilineatus]|uniref:zinc finger and BTB domain-containing protein 49-like n=1 Tax=Macrosteles quadrilineatus TaxID=74068 RepID=UPI0023E2C2B7|nr:zinc finger and BTB domain-containing protein 49-like [Macrosteles quadrilineatus]